MRSVHLLTSFVVLVALAAAPCALAAPVPLARDQFVSQLSADLSSHFKLEGELQLELIRPWSPPARLAETWSIELLEYPSVPASSMLVRCRVLADGANFGESTIVLRASLFRDVWVSRQPLVSGATFEPAELETRRVDLFRERDALPAVVGDRTYSIARAVN